MQLIPLTAVLIWVLSWPAFAQNEWIEYASKADLYTVSFPGEPTVQNTTYTSEFGYTLQARLYSAERNGERYSVTVVDYRDIEKLGAAKSKTCPAGAEPCIGNAIVGLGYWRMDLLGANDYATWVYLKREAKLTHFMWNMTDLVAGHQLQMTNRDESRTFVAIYMHENRLYILEGTTPKSAPEPAFFQQSLGFLDEKGNRIRYQSIYSNGIAHPQRLR